MSPDRQLGMFGGSAWPERTRGARPKARLLPAAMSERAQCRRECAHHRCACLSPSACCRAAAEALDPHPHPDLPDRRRLGALPVADGAARRCRARREGGAGARRRRTCQCADACRNRRRRRSKPRRSASSRRRCRAGCSQAATCSPSPTARSRSSPPHRRAAAGRARTSTPSSRAASRSSCSATAPASWTSGSATGPGTPRVDLTDNRSGAAVAMISARCGLRRMAQDRVDERDAVRGDGRRAPRHPLRLFQPGGAGAGGRPHLSRSAPAGRSRAGARPLRPVGLGHGARQDVLVALDVRHARLPALRHDAVLRRGRADHPPGRRRPVRARQTGSSRARSTRSTRSSACGTPTGSGCGCAPAPRSSTPRRRRSS